MDEDLQAPISEEAVIDLEAQVERAKLMKAMCATGGWKIMQAYFAGARRACVNSWRSEDKELHEFIASRQAYNAIDAIEAFVNSTIQVGDAAYERLHPTKRPANGDTG